MDYKSQLLATGLDQVALNSIKYGDKKIGAVSGAFAYLALGDAIKKGGIARSNATWNVLSTSLGCVSGCVFWKEQLSSTQFMGIFLAIISLYLMN